MGKEAKSPMDSNEFEARLTAQNGIDNYETADVAAAKDYSGILIVNDTVLASITCDSMSDASKLEGITLPAGLYIPGHFSAFTVTSGVLIAIIR